MLKGRELLGLPVVEVKSGKEIGKVEEIIPDFGERIVFGLRVERKGWFKEPKLIPFYSISNIGDSAIMISEYDEENSSKYQDEFNEIEKANEKMLGIEVITLDGKRLGIIEDVIVDTKSGTIKGLELSDGLIGDIISGRLYIPLPDDMGHGEDKIMVSPEFEGKIKANLEDVDEIWR